MDTSSSSSGKSDLLSTLNVDLSSSCPEKLKYDMLTGWHRQLLLKRPVSKSVLNRLIKQGLIDFLRGNNIQVAAATRKSVLVDMVMDLISKENPDIGDSESSSHSAASSTSASTSSSSSSAASSSSSSSAASSSSSSAASSSSSTSYSMNYDFLQDDITVPEPKLESKVGHDTVPKTHNNKNMPAGSTLNGLFKTLNPCNAIYIENSNLLDMDEGWELPPPCTCTISAPDLTQDLQLQLPQSMMNILTEMCSKPMEEIVQYLQAFGGELASSGCRVHLLLLVRDMLEGEASLQQPSTSQQEKLPGNSGDLKRKANFQVPSEVPVAKQNKSVPTATVTSASALKNFAPTVPTLTQSATVTGFSNATAAPTVPIRTQSATMTGFSYAPAVPTVSTQSQVQAKQALLSQQFSKTMAQQFTKWMWENPVESYVPPSASATSTTAYTLSAPSLPSQPAQPAQSAGSECCVCFDNRCEVAFSPCGHISCCVSCSQKCKECPVCRKKIKSRLTVFFSAA